jgi:hypothetical protein
LKRSPILRSAPIKSGAILKKSAPARKAAMKARKIRPTAEESEWMGAVAGLGCIVCRQQNRGFVPCAVHHIVEGNRRVGHLYTIGLCDPGHHQNSPDPEQISRHPYKARFTAAYGNEYDLLKTTQDILNWKSK